MQFVELLERNKRQKFADNKLLCIDPGGTTGIAVFHKGELKMVTQLDTIDSKTDKVNYHVIDDFLRSTDFDRIIIEDYRVYQHKLKEHSFSKIPTLRLIGAIEYYCEMGNIPIDYQMAMQAKGFATDAKLKSWGFWQTGMRHSRDAIRHGIYWLLFSKSC